MVKKYFLYWNSHKTSIRTSTEIQRIMSVKLTDPPVSKKDTSLFGREITTKRHGKLCWYDQLLPACYKSLCQVSCPREDASELLCLTQTRDMEF